MHDKLEKVMTMPQIVLPDLRAYVLAYIYITMQHFFADECIALP